MNYYELIFTTLPSEAYQQDLLMNTLGETGFDTFEELDFGFKAYIPTGDFNQDRLNGALSVYREMFAFSYEINLIPQKNWNEVWESNFEPMIIGDKIFVRATFHPPQPQYPYEIVIDPKMAFGTGHHQTTAMMLEMMLEENFRDKKVLDMGCGTGILAIMASRLGAREITAIDNDPVCFSSTVENAQLNKINNIRALCGDKELIPHEKHDIVLANINRNVLLDQMQTYSDVLVTGGKVYLSGFYEMPDLEIINNETEKLSIKYISHKKNKEWVAASYIKATDV
jgi:ribosomal protein L11 methyltransferase